MTNEIKEILDNTLEYLEGIDETRNTKILTTNETNILLDYITNLKLNQTKKVFDTIVGLIKNGETCSYRYLIYDLLGFQEKDYADLMGGLAITNMLVDYEDYKSRCEKAIEYLANCDWNCKDFENLYDILGGDDNEYTLLTHL